MPEATSIHRVRNHSFIITKPEPYISALICMPDCADIFKAEGALSVWKTCQYGLPYQQ